MKRNDLVDQFTDLLASLDPVTSIVDRLRRSLQAWDVEAFEEAGIHKQAIMDEMGRLGRVVAELQAYASTLVSQDAGEADGFSQAEKNAAVVWQLISNGNKVWETLGEQTTAMITAYLLSVDQPNIMEIKEGVYTRLEKEFGTDDDAHLAYDVMLGDTDRRFRLDKYLLQLKYRLDLSQGRIATLMGVTQPATQTRLTRAFARLVHQVGLRKLRNLAQDNEYDTGPVPGRRTGDSPDLLVTLDPTITVGLHVKDVPTGPGEEPDQNLWIDWAKRIASLGLAYDSSYNQAIQKDRIPIPVLGLYRRKTSEMVLFPTNRAVDPYIVDSVYRFRNMGLSNDFGDWGRSWEGFFSSCPRTFKQLHRLLG